MAAKWTEIYKLKDMLEREGIPFDWSKGDRIVQIEYPNGKRGRNGRVLSAIQGQGTFGGNQDLIEINGLLTEEEKKRNSVVGFLTAEEVYSRIDKHYSRD